jgi:hypothetical protein
MDHHHTLRASQAGSPQARSSIIGLLRQQPKVAHLDRLVIALNLGRRSAEADPLDPSTPAKRWFDAWHGSRWEKRKRYICFPGEVPQDPRTPGAYIASSADWASLIEAAAADLFPDATLNFEHKRENFRRDMLRGTTFVPEVATNNTDALALMVALAHKIETHISVQTDIEQLWSTLDMTPFAPEICSTLQPAGSKEFDEISIVPHVASAHFVTKWAVPDDANFRFSPMSANAIEDWAYPKIRIGMFGYRWVTDAFIAPPGYYDDWHKVGAEGRVTHQACIDDFAPDWIHSLLVSEGFATQKSGTRQGFKLSATAFSGTQKIGWTRLTVETPREVWIEIRPKDDGSPGLWLSSKFDDCPTIFPVVDRMDCLEIEAKSKPRHLDFAAFMFYEGYRLVLWPTHDRRFMDEDRLPDGAICALLNEAFYDEFDETRHPNIAGWLDDQTDVDLQDFIFRCPPNTRFIPAFPTHRSTPLPCAPGSIAAALFANNPLRRSDLLATSIITKAREVGAAGLSYHSKLIAYHQDLLDKL